jgi:hypothetical protein
VARESHFDLLPNTPLNSGDNHRPGCRTSDQVTIHLNGRQDVASRQGMTMRTLEMGSASSILFDIERPDRILAPVSKAGGMRYDHRVRVVLR